MKHYIFSFALIICIGCSDDAPPPAASGNVHMVGFITTADYAPVASYWRDGVYTKLVSDSAYSNVNSLFLDGTTALIGGYQVASPSQVFIWKNGSKTIISDAFGDGPLLASRDDDQYAVWFKNFEGWVMSINGASQPLLDTAESWPTSVALLNNDLYISGVALGPEYSRDPVVDYSDQYAQCWKNNELIFRESHRSFAWSVFTYQNDIYLGGNLQFPDANGIACYWKNGVRVDLTDGEESAVVRSIFVAEGHVYAAGNIGNHACYWKDGTINLLPHEGTVRSGGNSIAVRGDDVHIVGYDDAHPAYWKNGMKETFKHSTKRGELKVVKINE